MRLNNKKARSRLVPEAGKNGGFYVRRLFQAAAL